MQARKIPPACTVLCVSQHYELSQLDEQWTLCIFFLIHGLKPIFKDHPTSKLVLREGWSLVRGRDGAQRSQVCSSGQKWCREFDFDVQNFHLKCHLMHIFCCCFFQAGRQKVALWWSVIKGIACAIKGIACAIKGIACAIKGIACAIKGIACGIKGVACAIKGIACVIKLSWKTKCAYALGVGSTFSKCCYFALWKK